MEETERAASPSASLPPPLTTTTAAQRELPPPQLEQGPTGATKKTRSGMIIYSLFLLVMILVIGSLVFSVMSGMGMNEWSLYAILTVVLSSLAVIATVSLFIYFVSTSKTRQRASEEYGKVKEAFSIDLFQTRQGKCRVWKHPEGDFVTREDVGPQYRLMVKGNEDRVRRFCNAATKEEATAIFNQP